MFIVVIVEPSRNLDAVSFTQVSFCSPHVNLCDSIDLVSTDSYHNSAFAIRNARILNPPSTLAATALYTLGPKQGSAIVNFEIGQMWRCRYLYTESTQIIQ